MKTYGQFCALARALDLVGDRWTLLVVRELLVADATYGELLEGLPGIATNLLADRLRRLEDDGLAWREAAGKSARYGLTPRGRDLAGVVHALVRWGAPEMLRGRGDDRFRPEWLVVALSALAEPGRGHGRLAFVVNGARVVVDLAAGTAVLGEHPAEATIETDPESALALASGAVRLATLTGSGRARCDHPRKAATMLHVLAATETGRVGDQAAMPVSAR